MVKEADAGEQEVKIHVARRRFYVKVAAVCSFFTLQICGRTRDCNCCNRGCECSPKHSLNGRIPTGLILIVRFDVEINGRETQVTVLSQFCAPVVC